MDIERFNKKKNNIKNLIEILYKNVSINIAGAVEELEEIAIGNLELYNCELETNKKLKKELDELSQLHKENEVLKRKLLKIFENIDISYNEWEKWKDDLSKLKESDK